jgi:hypothetical protein
MKVKNVTYYFANMDILKSTKCLSENYIEQDLSASHVNKCQPVLRFFAPAHGNAAAFG